MGDLPYWLILLNEELIPKRLSCLAKTFTLSLLKDGSGLHFIQVLQLLLMIFQTILND